jgi:Ser/Thr protein kinase RdoA (MazF antagonist)
VLTLWELREHDPGAQVDASALSAALRAFHEAFVGYPRRLPSFTDQIEDAGRVLSDDALAPALARDDRELLRAAQRRLLGSLRGAALSERPLHGDPHPDGNVLLTPQGPLLVDFEAACMGPVEWDLTSTGTEVARTYPGADPALVDILSVARSLCVATWCWMQPERDPAVAEAARWHLTRIRQAVG